MSLSLSTAELLAELFATIAECESMVELARKELADHDGFEPYGAFSRLGGNVDGEIDERDVANFCNENAIECNLTDAALLISQYDENGNGKLTFHEFSSLVLPATNATLRAMAINRDYDCMVPKTPFILETLEHALSLVFLREIDYQRRVEAIRAELNSKKDFNSSVAFKIIDTGNPPRKLDRYEIRAFVNDHLKWLEEEDLDAVIRRWDTDGDELLVFSEFDDVVKNARPVRTVPRLEETLIKPARFGADNISPEVVYSSPRSPRNSPPRVGDTRYRAASPVRSTVLPRSEDQPYTVPKKNYNYEPVRRVNYEAKAHSPPRMTRAIPREHYVSFKRSGSPLRGYEENELAESFKDLIALESELEISKQALALRSNFTLNDAFKIFDFGMLGHITALDIREVFDIYGIWISLEEAKLIMSRYDNDADGVLRFDEFIDMFLPKDLYTSDCLADRSALYPSGYYALPEIPDPVTRNDFVQVLALNTKVENHAESIRQKHSERPLFNKTDAYYALNKLGDLSLTKDDFARLLEDHRFFATNNELTTLIDRFDKNKDGRVSYSEFVNEITPHSPERF